MLSLYPAIKPYKQHELNVAAPHKLYLEESGEPSGIPVVFVHGGPGAGCTTEDRRFFDPEKYRIILFDQRGAGRSTPHAELSANTTDDLINDMEAIRQFLNVDKWVLFGGSWGSTLALAYAQKYPERTLGLIVRGVFLSRDEDFDWFINDGTRRIFPDAYANFLRHIPEAERSDLIGAYYKRLTGDDQLAQMAAAKAWAEYEGRCATLHPSQKIVTLFTNPHAAMSIAKTECHYFKHKCFLSPNQLLANADKLKGIPGTIVHGRYDMICPLDNATKLSEAWPDARLHIVRDAGHSAFEPGVATALVSATQNMIYDLS